MAQQAQAQDEPKLTQEQATQALADLVQQAKDSLEAAKMIANEYGLTFKWSDEYGSHMQSYFGKGTPEVERWSSSNDDSYYYDERPAPDEQGGFWVSSSMNC